MSQQQPRKAQTQIQFSKLRISVKYETSFGQNLWLVGSAPFLSEWNPDNKSGIEMQWSDGHIWYADIPYVWIVEQLADQNFEFKFVVKRNNGGDNYSVDRWEGGNSNHKFNGIHVQQVLSADTVKQFVTQRMERATEITIGDMEGAGSLQLMGQGSNIRPTQDKSTLKYNKEEQALIYYQYWQD